MASQANEVGKHSLTSVSPALRSGLLLNRIGRIGLIVLLVSASLSGRQVEYLGVKW